MTLLLRNLKSRQRILHKNRIVITLVIDSVSSVNDNLSFYRLRRVGVRTYFSHEGLSPKPAFYLTNHRSKVINFRVTYDPTLYPSQLQWWNVDVQLRKYLDMLSISLTPYFFNCFFICTIPIVTITSYLYSWFTRLSKRKKKLYLEVS